MEIVQIRQKLAGYPKPNCRFKITLRDLSTGHRAISLMDYNAVVGLNVDVRRITDRIKIPVPTKGTVRASNVIGINGIRESMTRFESDEAREAAEELIRWCQENGVSESITSDFQTDDTLPVAAASQLPVPVMPDSGQYAKGSPFDSIREFDEEGREFWSARRLMGPLGYDKWERFADAVERAEIACQNTGLQSGDHFSRRREKSTDAAGRPSINYHLTRYACYLTAMNGDPRKPEIAAAQQYFAIRTHQAETQSDHVTGMLQVMMEQIKAMRDHSVVLADHDRRIDDASETADKALAIAEEVRGEVAKISTIRGAYDGFYCIYEFARHIGSVLGKYSRRKERQELGRYFTLYCEQNGIPVKYAYRHADSGHLVNGYTVEFLNSMRHHFNDFEGNRPERVSLIPSLANAASSQTQFFPFVNGHNNRI